MVLAFPPLYFFSAVVPLLARWLLHQRRVPPLRSSVQLGRRLRRRRGLPLLRGWPSFVSTLLAVFVSAAYISLDWRLLH